MKSLVKTLVLTSVLAGGFSLSAFAADDDIDVLTAPVETLVEFGSGWYLRGDISASINGGRFTENYSDATTETDYDIADMIGFGIGMGYRFSNNLRADVTVGHYLSGDYEATSDANDCTGLRLDPSTGNWNPVSIANCSAYDAAEYDAFVLMASGYYDIAPIGRFEPYVGAGVGIARVRWQEVTGGRICAPVPASVVGEVCDGTNGDIPIPNEPYRYGGSKQGGIDYRLAYSLSAGFAYRLKENLLLDASYRFMGVGNQIGLSSLGNRAQSAAKNGFGLHQINVGLRYEIW